jgi:hypothetical protein
MVAILSDAGPAETKQRPAAIGSDRLQGAGGGRRYRILLWWRFEVGSV